MTEYIKPLLKWWWLLLIATFLALGSSYYVVTQQPPIYTAQTTLLIGRTIANPNPSTNEIWLAQQLGYFYADLARRDIVQEATKKALGMDWLPEYRVIPSSNSQLIEIQVMDTDPERAARVADELANQLISLSPTNVQGEDRAQREFVKQQLEVLQKDITETSQQISQKQQELGKLSSAREIADAEQEIQALQAKLTLLQTNYSNLLSSSQSQATNVLSVIDPAIVPEKPSGPNKIVIIGLAGLFGLVLAGGVSYFLEYLDQNLSTPEEITQELSLPLLGLITEAKGLTNGSPYVIERPRSIVAEAFRALRMNLNISYPQEALRTLFVTSLEVGDGKTFVTINLASTYARSGMRTIIVDADLHRPNVHRVLDIPNSRGLSEILLGEVEIDDAIQPIEDNLIGVIPAGDTSKVDNHYFDDRAIETVLYLLKEKADILIIDGMPLFVPETMVWARQVNGVLLVVRPGRVRRKLSRTLVEKFQGAGSNLLGVVLNRMRISNLGFYNRYRYYYPYYGYHDSQGGGEKDGRNSARFSGTNGKKRRVRIGTPGIE